MAYPVVSWRKNLSWALCSLALLLPLPLNAQVQVSPMVIKTETSQGMANGVISLTNQGTQSQRVRLSAESFTYTRTGFATAESDPYDLSPYLMFSPRELVLEPGQTRRVRLITRMLPSTANGEYRSVIFAEPLRERDEAGGGLSIRARVGVTVYVKHGQVNFALTPVEASYDPTKQEFQLLVSNPSNGTVQSKGTWTLSQNDQPLLQADIDQRTVIAGGDRLFPLELPPDRTNLPAGTYQVAGQLQWSESGAVTTTPFSFDVTVPAAR
ncbi:hypothetical protein [Picosynechococcus sp. PCC 73109]|uniref:hypothetical protein n=1 Tax=Picosynechococcus sp. PCC 73109 TaxID=374982 RepID=UPI00074590B4|nr:hypothetical protein [Picosynechococcus sp. PCC 73109]AMA10149.1 hypothetical protein AWQ23_12940 [Picosynechococcus sp. PCC 73109]